MRRIVVAYTAERGEPGIRAASGAIRRWNPRDVLILGSAAGLDRAGIRLGDVLLADSVADYVLRQVRRPETQLLWHFRNADPRLLFAAQALSPQTWLSRITVPRPAPGQPTSHIGTLCTGDRVVADSLLGEHRDTWRRLVGVGLEPTSVFQLPDAPAHLTVCGVAALADDVSNLSDAGWHSYACDAVAAFTIELLKNIPLSPAG
jgi:hypothetical protein